MKSTWKGALQDRRFVAILIVTLIALVVLTFFMPYFFGAIVAGKKGTVLHDFILDLFVPRDWSWTIFTLIYTTVFLTFATNYRNAHATMLLLATWAGVTWMRMLTIYLFTLEPPVDMIYLEDPFLRLVVYPGDSGQFGKDLFFSGHVSTMTVCFLMEPRRVLKYIKIAATIAVAVLLMAQHVHYALDVIMAPLLTYLVYKWVVQTLPGNTKMPPIY